jgi:copper chaperone CopZ
MTKQLMTEPNELRVQVVVLRVSLHCKGCAGKVKKHIAKMEGVTSFDIDIASKKVTVVGDVTPLGVLNSVSKVKPAQFWPSSPPRTCPPRASASF